MGLEVILISTAVLASAAAAVGAMALMQRPKQNQNNLSPASLDQLNITQAQEGSPVPLIYGQRRVTGNIIYVGGLTTEEIVQEVEGGKGGGGSQDQVVGHKVFLDIWQSIAWGKYELVDVYVNDKNVDPVASNVIFNDGTNGLFPTEPGANANAIKGVCHIFYKKLLLGENATSAPTIHFVVKRILGNDIVFANMSNGSNPAAIVYDILRLADVPTSEIDIAAFIAAATFWNSKGYGLNLIIDQQAKVVDLCNKVLGFVESSMFIDFQGRYSIKAHDPSQSYTRHINTDEFISFTMQRAAYSQVINDFRGSFIDAAQDYTQRMVVAMNEAAVIHAGNRNSQNFDLSGYRDLTTASKRITEIMKLVSYPHLEIAFTVNLSYSTLLPGDIVRITNSDYGVVSADFRISEVDSQNVEKNTVGVKARQVSETLFDDVFVTVGGTEQVPITTSLENLTNVRIFEMPYTTSLGFLPAFLVLAPRKKGFETSFVVLFSFQNNANFVQKAELTTFSQYGTLVGSYPVTRTIDRTTGITYQTTSFDPLFSNISDEQLFNSSRFALIDNEIIAFRDVQSLGSGQYKLTHCIRGVLNTQIASHSNGAAIHIFSLGNNILPQVDAGSFYLKLVPVFGGNSLEPSLATAHQVTTNYTAKKPRSPGLLKAVRTGTTVVLEIFPTTPDVFGAGASNPDSVTDTPPHPFPMVGDLELSYPTFSPIYITNTTHTFTGFPAGSTAITVKHRRFGYLSPGLVVTVGVANGTYYA